jgi:hypothetical protein
VRAKGDFMVHHVAVLVRGDDEKWNVYLPDFQVCRAEGETAEATINRAKSLARDAMNGSNSNFERFPPRTFAEIRNDPAWALDRTSTGRKPS